MALTNLDITDEEVFEIYTYIMTMLGAENIDVSLTEGEIRTLICKGLRDYMYEINQWTIRNKFADVLGTNADVDFTNKFVMDNGILTKRMSDWFSSMARVGGKTPWKKDYIILKDKQQIYDLATESGTPYTPGSRRIHKIMWQALPTVFGSNITNDIYQSSLWGFDAMGGLTYNNSPLNYLGNIFDVMLLGNSMSLRNRILRSEFFYNISGDIVELTPMPGGRGLNFTPGSFVWYYYFDEKDFLGLDGQNADNVLISNPSQMQLNTVAWSALNSVAKNWIENYALALSKYTLGAKFRLVRKIANPGGDYEIELDWASLLNESKEEREALKEKLREDLKESDLVKLYENKALMAGSANKFNKNEPRGFFIG